MVRDELHLRCLGKQASIGLEFKLVYLEMRRGDYCVLRGKLIDTQLYCRSKMDMIEYSSGRARCLSRMSNEKMDYMNRLLLNKDLATTPVCFLLQDDQNVVRVTLRECTEHS